MIILFEKKKKTQAFKFLIEKTHRSHMNKNIYMHDRTTTTTTTTKTTKNEATNAK